jgi:DNA adenine methylase
MIQPFLKWNGDRTYIINDIIRNYPTTINNYYEMFTGGCSVLFAFLCYIHKGLITCNGNIYAYDINEPLIYVYKNIQSNHNELYETLETINNEFNEINNINDYNIDVNDKTPKTIKDAKLSRERYYYWIKNKYATMTDNEKLSILGSAYFIFLNKSTYKGLFKTNFKTTEIISKNYLTKIHHLIKNVIFEYGDLSLIKETIKDNDFIYIDSIAYKNIIHFNKLYNFCNYLKKINIKLIITNLNMKIIYEILQFDKYNIITYEKSIFNLKYKKNGEIIIKNYDS